jgi:ketosteroid isomerase-like protein
MRRERGDHVAYLLRLSRSDREGQPVWRATLESLHNSHRLAFGNLEGLLAYLRERFGQAQDGAAEHTAAGKKGAQPTSVEENKAYLRRWFAAIDARDLATLEVLAEQSTPDCAIHDPGFPDLARGPAVAMYFARMFAKNPPAWRMTLLDLFGEGDRVACRVSTNDTDPATGKPVGNTTLLIYRFAGDKVAEVWQLVKPEAW